MTNSDLKGKKSIPDLNVHKDIAKLVSYGSLKHTAYYMDHQFQYS